MLNTLPLLQDGSSKLLPAVPQLNTPPTPFADRQTLEKELQALKRSSAAAVTGITIVHRILLLIQVIIIMFMLLLLQIIYVIIIMIMILLIKAKNCISKK